MVTVSNIVFSTLALFCCLYDSTALETTCTVPPYEDAPTKWANMVNPCIDLMEAQIQTEINAALTYMAMGAYFSRDTVNRPGFAKMFFESASEEREHAIKLIEYLLMRGNKMENVNNLIKNTVTEKTSWDQNSGVEALKDALELETKVTEAITNIIKVCENPKQTNSSKPSAESAEPEAFNDYHLVDYLTGVYLEEQYRGQRDLAGKLSTLGKMIKNHGPLGEFLFDKKLLNGELPTFG